MFNFIATPPVNGYFYYMIDSSDPYHSSLADSLADQSTASFDSPVGTLAPNRDEDALLLNSPLVDELSVSHVGHWNTLVSRTNWEKGSLILQWRATMVAAEVPKTAYSDDAWSRRVGNVTPQHVGRLRRVAERFGEKAKDYSDLFWSHFQAAMDWEDAEMWLEGAVQNGWSVAQMRVQRWEAVGAPEEMKPRSEDVFTAELDEDVSPGNDATRTRGGVSQIVTAKVSEIGPADIVEGFDSERPPRQEETGTTSKKPRKSDQKSKEDVSNGHSTGELLDQLGNCSDLPSDLAEAFETLKIAVLNHKLSGWKEVSPHKLIKKIDLIKSLVGSTDEA